MAGITLPDSPASRRWFVATPIWPPNAPARRPPGRHRGGPGPDQGEGQAHAPSSCACWPTLSSRTVSGWRRCCSMASTKSGLKRCAAAWWRRRSRRRPRSRHRPPALRSDCPCAAGRSAERGAQYDRYRGQPPPYRGNSSGAGAAEGVRSAWRRGAAGIRWLKRPFTQGRCHYVDDQAGRRRSGGRCPMPAAIAPDGGDNRREAPISRQSPRVRQSAGNSLRPSSIPSFSA